MSETKKRGVILSIDHDEELASIGWFENLENNAINIKEVKTEHLSNLISLLNVGMLQASFDRKLHPLGFEKDAIVIEKPKARKRKKKTTE